MRILMLVNWKVSRCDTKPEDKQPPDYIIKEYPYWFFRYFKETVDVDVVDISTFPWLEHFEKEKLRFYIIQTLKVLPCLNRYDVILSHGMQSGIVLSLIRRFFPIKARHIVFDIGSFNSAAESGMALKLMQFASKSIDGIIYHTSKQKEYYDEFFPWIITKSRFIRFGTDAEFFGMDKSEVEADIEVPYILCVGSAKRDWQTLCQAFELLQEQGEDNVLIKGENKKVRLKLIGNSQLHLQNESVEILSFIPVTQLIREIREALFCVLPLEYFRYSFGQMTLLQQMALGKAVVAAEVPSMLDYVTDGVDAFLYKPGNIHDLYHKMSMLLRDSEIREEMGNKAADSIQKNWNEQFMAEEIEKYINEVMLKERA